jgi:hypothetical protein
VIRRLDVILSVLIPACFHARPILSVRHAWQLNSATRSPNRHWWIVLWRAYFVSTEHIVRTKHCRAWKIHHISGSWGGSYN